MNTFTKRWLCATCAPESIINLKSDNIKNNYLDVVKDEFNTKQILVLSNNDLIIGIGTNLNEVLDSPNYTFSTGLSKLAELLNLTSYSIT